MLPLQRRLEPAVADFHHSLDFLVVADGMPEGIGGGGYFQGPLKVVEVALHAHFLVLRLAIAGVLRLAPDLQANHHAVDLSRFSLASQTNRRVSLAGGNLRGNNGQSKNSKQKGTWKVMVFHGYLKPKILCNFGDITPSGEAGCVIYDNEERLFAASQMTFVCVYQTSYYRST